MRDIGNQIGISYSVISYWETGNRVPRVEDVATFLAALGVIGEQRESILDLARHAGDTDWLASGVPGVSQGWTGVMECERSASTITDWSPWLIPGLLQTTDYARAILGGNDRDPEAELRVTLRAGRRDALTRENPATLVALIGEPAIRQRISDQQTGVAQLKYLLTAADSSNVTVQIIPIGDGYHPGLVGPFTLYQFLAAPPIVHIEHHRSSAFLYDSEDVTAFEAAAEEVRREAMSPEASSGLIADVITEQETTA